MIRRALPLLALVAVAPLLLGAAGDTVRVTPLARDGQVYVSFSLDGGLTPDMRETIRSGLQTTYRVRHRASARRHDLVRPHAGDDDRDGDGPVRQPHAPPSAVAGD